MKTVTVDVPVEVRKNDDGTYQYREVGGGWSNPYTESAWRIFASPGAAAVCKAIDSGAFVDPLPTTVGATVLSDGVTFTLTDTTLRNVPAHLLPLAWNSSVLFGGRGWHSSAQVQSYGEFRVLWDGEATS